VFIVDKEVLEKLDKAFSRVATKMLFRHLRAVDPYHRLLSSPFRQRNGPRPYNKDVRFSVFLTFGYPCCLGVILGIFGKIYLHSSFAILAADPEASEVFVPSLWQDEHFNSASQNLSVKWK
jgi:hypothetical protein